jgi:hypothetical protein
MKAKEQTPWFKVVSNLGLESLHDSPTLFKCPFCEIKWLRFTLDSLYGGHRYYTECCKKHGNLIDLISELCKREINGAMAWLNERSPELHMIHARRQELESKLEPRRRALEQVWETSWSLLHASALQTFTDLLENRGLRHTPHSSYHEDGLHHQFRLITASTFREVSGVGLERIGRFFAKALEKERGLIVGRMFTGPEQLSGLFCAGIGYNNQHEEFVIPLDCDNGRETGFLIHPDLFFGAEPLVLTPDLGLALNAAFVIEEETPKLSPVIGYVEEQECRTRRFSILGNHPKLIWAPSLRPDTLNLASRLDCSMTYHGAVNGRIRNDVFNMLVTWNPFTTLLKTGKHWTEQFRELRKGWSTLEIVAFLRKAKISGQAIRQLEPGERPEVIEAFVAYVAECPEVAITTADGVVEQRPNGWTLVRRGKETLICSHCWRIHKMFHSEERGMECIVQFLSWDGWVGGTAKLSDLTNYPQRTLTRLAIECRIGSFTVAPKWAGRLLHIANQFNPPPQVERTRMLGLDGHDDCFRTTHALIDLAHGQLEDAECSSELTLFPEGGVDLPSQAAVQAIISHMPTCRVVSALVYQLAHYAGLHRQVVVSCPEGAVSQARVVFHQCGFFDNKAAPLLDLSDLRNHAAWTFRQLLDRIASNSCVRTNRSITV